MVSNIEAMKQMVEALEIAAEGGGVDFYAYAKEGRQAIAEAEKQEPVKREPLTDEQIKRIWESLPFCNGAWETFAREIEAAHGIKE